MMASSVELPPAQLHYFACRSRGEPIRLLCALIGRDFEEWSVPEVQHNGRRQLPPPPGDPAPRYLSGEAGKLNNLAAFPLGTCPAWVERIGDEEVVINQSMAILRHLARGASLLGTKLAEQAFVDVWLDQCEDVRTAYSKVIYGLDGPPFSETLGNDDALVAAKFAAHTPSVEAAFQPFEKRLAESSLLAGEAITVADIALFDIFDMHLRVWAGALTEAAFPFLHAHRARVSAQPGVAAYLASGKRWSIINGNNLG